MKLQLDRVTLVTIAGSNLEAHKRAFNICLHYADFASARFISSIDAWDMPNFVKIPPMDIKGYNKFLAKNLDVCFDTEFVLVAEWDGHILNPDAWRDEFYDYDYIGAPWLYMPEGKNIGNSGFSLQSKRLTSIMANDPTIKEIHDKRYDGYYPFDALVADYYRPYLESKGIKYPSKELAFKFSAEGRKWTSSTFGFHGVPCITDLGDWVNPIEEQVGPTRCSRNCVNCNCPEGMN